MIPWKNLNMIYANYAFAQKNAPKWYQEKEHEEAKAMDTNKEIQKQENTNNETQEWLNYKNKLGAALTQIYPLSKKQTQPAEPSWVTKLEKWGN